MAALGARFLDTDVETATPLLSLRSTQANDDGIALFLYETVNPNRGNYTPTKSRIVKDAREAIAWMVSDKFRFEAEIILFDGISSPAPFHSKHSHINF